MLGFRDTVPVVSALRAPVGARRNYLPPQTSHRLSPLDQHPEGVRVMEVTSM